MDMVAARRMPVAAAGRTAGRARSGTRGATDKLERSGSAFGPYTENLLETGPRKPTEIAPSLIFDRLY